MSADFDRIPEIALNWIKSGKTAALATVVQTWGSSPRPVGAQLAISGEGEIAGSVSGGCVEGAVVIEAMEALKDGAPRILHYGVEDDDAFSTGLACGGEIRVLVEPIGVGQGPDVADIEALVAARSARQMVAWIVNTLTWERRLSFGAGDPLATEIASRQRQDKSGFEGDWFIGIHNPPLRLIVVGAVHIAQPLMPMARALGFDTVLVDPRESFASADRFPGERLVHDWPDEALKAEGLDARTAVITLSHDPKIDDPAILTALNSDVFYLGCLGSHKTHAKRVIRMKAAGLTERQIARIHGPVGLKIGAISPAEIALSALSEVTERLRKG